MRSVFTKYSTFSCKWNTNTFRNSYCTLSRTRFSLLKNVFNLVHSLFICTLIKNITALEYYQSPIQLLVITNNNSFEFGIHRFGNCRDYILEGAAKDWCSSTLPKNINKHHTTIFSLSKEYNILNNI